MGWTKARRLFVATAFCTLGAACSGPADDTGATERQADAGDASYRQSSRAIRGGYLADMTEAVVGIRMHYYRGTGTCTGTLIAPNLVLTARHCIDSSTYNGSCQGSYFGAPAGKVEVTPNVSMSVGAFYYTAAESYRPSTQRFCGGDIALLRLERSIPKSEATPIPPRLTEVLRGDETFSTLGYGKTSPGGSSGKRHRIDNQKVRCLGTSCKLSAARDGEFMGGGHSCKGDSGGPALMPGEGVIGVTSRGYYDCTQTLYTSAIAWRELIQSAGKDAAAKGGYPAPSWTKISDDTDGDGYLGPADNCPDQHNLSQTDTDEDGLGDPCDPDQDDDGLKNEEDACPKRADKPHDGPFGETCDPDVDGDGVPNIEDNCPRAENAEQADRDGDGTGDACADPDNDGLVDADDNCPEVANPEQIDSDGDWIGDACDPEPIRDADDDGIARDEDNCPSESNPEQTDTDGDGEGDACDPTPLKDPDGDGYGNSVDNCPNVPNNSQADTDGDGKGDACDDDSPSPDTGMGPDAGGSRQAAGAKAEGTGCSTSGSSAPGAPLPLQLTASLAIVAFLRHRRRR